MKQYEIQEKNDWDLDSYSIVEPKLKTITIFE